MKKMFFIAIATIAFSSISFGNTIKVEECIIDVSMQESIIAKNVIVDNEETPDSCLAGKLTVYNQSIGYGMSPSQATNMAYRFYFMCMQRVVSFQ